MNEREKDVLRGVRKKKENRLEKRRSDIGKVVQQKKETVRKPLSPTLDNGAPLGTR